MRKYILLTFEDLLPQFQKKYSIDKIDNSSFKFKSSSISMDEIFRADFIIFVHEADRKILKDRFC